MKTVLRDDHSGVSEVVGTILILAMTVVLFSTIILWVGSIPSPTTQTRVDIRPTMVPVYNKSGVEIGVNITLLHRGVESMNPANTLIFVTSQRGTNPPSTDRVILHRYNPLLGTPSGIIDGPDSVWDIGERWAYTNYNRAFIQSSDQISVAVVDIVKNAVVWTALLTTDPGTRPPIFTEKWTDDVTGTPAIDPVQATRGFFLYARVFDQDADLNKNSVWATLTIWFGTGDSCAVPQQMFDNGIGADSAANDGIFTLGGISCMSPPFPSLSWDGSVILLNATDLKGHQTKTRLVLQVVEPFTQGEIQTIPTTLWQYIGFVQVRAEQVWFTHMNERVGTTNRFPLGRVMRSDLNGGGGALFHLQMANHGNRTVFIDGWTVLAFRSAGSSNVFTVYIVCGTVSPKCPSFDPSKAANANPGGLLKYPGVTSTFSDFQYAQVFDINLLNQETGGAPVEILAVSRTPFACCLAQTWGSDSFFPSILVSGMAGPVNMTYQQILSRWGPSYNPYDHLLDADPSTRTQWYAQVIPFIGMVVY